MTRRFSPAEALRLTTLAVGALVMITPFLYMVSTSFKAQQYVLKVPPQFIPDPATLSNYERVLVRGDFVQYFFNSAFVAVTATAISVLLSAMMAYGFARYRFPGREWLFRILLLGLMIPALMLIVPQFVLAKWLGLIDTLWGLIVFYVAGNLALNTFLLRGFFEEIPWELEEAMIIDGATAWRRFGRLVMPLSRPALATVTIFSFLACWDEYVWALTIINDPNKRTLPIAISLFEGQHLTDWGLVFAASVIAVAPVLVVFAIFQRQFISGLSSGALKA